MSRLGTIPLSEIPDVVSNGQCIGCGFCQVPLDSLATSSPISMQWSSEEEIWVPVVDPTDRLSEDRICPGAVMDMPALSERVFGHQPSDPIVGEAVRIAAGHATDESVRSRAASGGITTAILTHLFEAGAIDATYCTFGRSPTQGEGRLVRSSQELISASGSHYHPVDFGAALQKLSKGNERFAFVGLPCEVAAMREVMLARPDIADRCVVLIGLFCGGINRFSGIARYLEHFGISGAAVKEIDYRDGAWPGQIRLKTGDGEKTVPRIFNNTRWRILRYVIAFQGYWMLPRCRICPDQIADFADIAVGDPHLPRFKDVRSPGHSAVVARTARGLSILQSSEISGAIALEPLSRDEIVRSQGYTLENRRQATLYAKIARTLGMTPPKVSIYAGLEKHRTRHQAVYAYVDLLKVKARNWRWLRPFHLPIQVFEYLFLTFSVRLLLMRLNKLIRGV